MTVVYPVARRHRCPPRHRAHPRRHRRLRARAGARRLRALRPRGRRRRGAAQRRRDPARRRAARGHGHVQRPARLHLVRRDARAGDRHRRPEPLSDRDERGHPRQRRHARGLHGRRDHGRVRRPAGHGRPCRPRPGGVARHARAPRGLQRVAARRGAARGVQDGHRPQQRPGDVRPRRLRAPPGVHGAGGHDEHRRAPGGHDQGHALPALRGRLDPQPPQRSRHEDLVEVGEFEVRGRTATVKLWSLREEPVLAEAESEAVEVT